ncbi:endosome protein [Ephemerocybe angulata]|uniref:Endosome protein n=1 Tax=Ephemerocybe angulata TaxID=980116 RepID=A0A8H6HSA8_9AGAR|nr:endosome protein [Tulosesus angulatus]
MGFLNSLKGKLKDLSHHDQGAGSSADAPPPEWSAAPEISHKWGKWNEAPDEEYQAGEDFCNEYPPLAPRLLPSDLVDKINTLGCKAWGIQWPTTPRFSGHIQEAADTKGGPAVTTVTTTPKCKDTCLLSDMPILAGLYEVQGKTGVYYEVLVQKMEGSLQSARRAAHTPNGACQAGTVSAQGCTSTTCATPGDTIGCGYEFASGNSFYTYNGVRLPNAFSGLYIPRNQHDVFAAIGVEGECQFQVNFGGEVFRWKEGNEWAWRVEGHVGRLSGTSGPRDDELPAYEA